MFVHHIHGIGQYLGIKETIEIKVSTVIAYVSVQYQNGD